MTSSAHEDFIERFVMPVDDSVGCMGSCPFLYRYRTVWMIFQIRKGFWDIKLMWLRQVFHFYLSRRVHWSFCCSWQSMLWLSLLDSSVQWPCELQWINFREWMYPFKTKMSLITRPHSLHGEERFSHICCWNLHHIWLVELLVFQRSLNAVKCSQFYSVKVNLKIL